MPPLPAGYTWRPLVLDDARHMAELSAASARVDGNPLPLTAAGYAGRLAALGAGLADDTFAAVDDRGRLAGFAWVTYDNHLAHEFRACLAGMVSPGQRGRGLGRALLSWSEMRGRTVAESQAHGRPLVLRIDTYDEQNPVAEALYERLGFRLALAEEDMRRDLAEAVPALSLPAGLREVPWIDEHAGRFYAVFVDAFRSRPGFRPMSQADWQAMYTGFPTFRSDLSYLVLDGDRPAAYVVSAVEDAENALGTPEGWIVQMGVGLAWRRRGLGRALLAGVLRRFQALGLPYAMLNVNVNNPEAAALYRDLGFLRTRRVASYRKP